MTVESNGFGWERRSGPRVPLSGELVIFVESTGQFLERHGKDISEGGMFLESPAPPPPGTRLRFLIQPSGGSGLIRGLAEVAWRRQEAEGPDRPAGMGLRFLSMNPEGQALIRRLVAERAGTPPPAIQPEPELEEPFPVEPEPVPPSSHPAEDVFEEAPSQSAPEPAVEEEEPEEPETLLDRPLPEIGRPFGYDEHQASRRRRKVRLMTAMIILGIVVLAGLAAWYMGWLGSTGVALRTVTAHREVAQRGSNMTGVTTAERMPPASATPAAAPAAGPTASAPAAAAPTSTPMPTATATRGPNPSPTPARVPTPPPPPPPAHAIRSIRWARFSGGTTVRIVPAGALTPGQVHLVRLDDPPRVLVRIRGIRSPYPKPVIQVGTSELQRMRVWLHRELSPPELYVVLDLKRAGLGVTEHLKRSTIIVTLSRPRAR